MDVFLETMRNFFIAVFEGIGLFFRKIGEKLNDCRIFVVSGCKKFFEKIKLKKEEFLKRWAIKKEAKKAAAQFKKEENLKAKQESEQRKREKAEQRTIYLKSTGARIFRGFLNVFDVIFDVVFVCGLFFCLRPELLNFENKNSYFREMDFDSLKLILFENLLPESSEIPDLTIFIIACVFVAYFLYKMIFSLATANGVNKLVSVLLTMITLVSVALVKDKLLIFLVLYILLFATFQFSCGFDFNVVKVKFVSFICLSFIAYIALLCVFDELFRNFAVQLVKRMWIPVKWL